MPPVAVVTANPITYQSDITLIAHSQQQYVQDPRRQAAGHLQLQRDYSPPEARP
jgi:hypothetical protein